MNSEPDLLRIEVVEDEIVVSLPKSQLSVTYYKSDKSPRLLAKRITEKYDPRTPMTMSEFLAKAWKLANDRARELAGSCEAASWQRVAHALRPSLVTINCQQQHALLL